MSVAAVRGRRQALATKIATISDIDGGYDALRPFPETYEETWALGSLAGFAPKRAGVIGRDSEDAWSLPRLRSNGWGLLQQATFWVGKA